DSDASTEKDLSPRKERSLSNADVPSEELCSPPLDTRDRASSTQNNWRKTINFLMLNSENSTKPVIESSTGSVVFDNPLSKLKGLSNTTLPVEDSITGFVEFSELSIKKLIVLRQLF